MPVRNFRVAFVHSPLKHDSAAHGINHAGELSEQPISSGLDNAAPVLGDAWLNQLGAVGGERRECSFLVLAHKPGVSRYVGGEDSGEAALDAFFGHVSSHVSWRNSMCR